MDISSGFIESLQLMEPSERIEMLRQQTLDTPHRLSVEQARIITESYRQHEGEPKMLQRAHALKAAMEDLSIDISDGELIVGNRSREVGAGIVFPEGGIGWLSREIDVLETRAQDRFLVDEEDKRYFREELEPYWAGKTLEDCIYSGLSSTQRDCEVVGKLNQKDHAQGHICPDVRRFLLMGPCGLKSEAEEKLSAASPESADYYRATILVMEGAIAMIRRYAVLAQTRSLEADRAYRTDYSDIARICFNLAERPAADFHEALQAVWFLFVFLQMESNASSFSPGRADQYLYPYFARDLAEARLTLPKAQELLDAFFIKFNQIVYMRNSRDAAFFSGFPIGFNIAIGGQTVEGTNAENLLTHLFLNAQRHVRLRQPNLSARIYAGSSEAYLRHIAKVISLGTGMPQVFNDEAAIVALTRAGFEEEDARDYAIIGCVELGTHGNTLSFSDAGMFNLVKCLEITLNNGIDVLSGKQLGLPLGTLEDFARYEQLESAFAKQIRFFWDIMESGLRVVEKAHRDMMPSPFLSSVIRNCMENGVDVTAGGAFYNKSGIQLIQVANIADSLAALKKLVYEEGLVHPAALLEQLRADYPDERIRQTMLNRAPKYGNDVEWVDEIGAKWTRFFHDMMREYTNFRGGIYTMGLYTVSAHVPMGGNVAATPDGRKSREPLADGGMSAVYGRDQNGPTALLRSVSRIPSELAANGTLLNMKFSPRIFSDEEGIRVFCALLRGINALRITHAQFNVVNREDLQAAKRNPEKHRHLLVRVAGYTAQYTDLNERLQDEIIARTEY